MAKLGELIIELAANTARLQSDMGKAIGIAERGAAKIKSAFSFVAGGVGGGLISTALIGAAKNAIKLGDDLNKAAIKAGVGGKAISELAYAAKQADVDLGSLSTALKKMQVFLSEANSGGKSQVSTLKALGMEYKQLAQLSPDKQFEVLAERISQLTDQNDKARAATELFGKAGADLLPFFEQGAEGIRKAREEAQKLGFSFDDKMLKKLADADDAATRLGSAWDRFALTLTAKVEPALEKVFNLLATGDMYAGNNAARLDAEIADLESQLATGTMGGRAVTRAQVEQELRIKRGIRSSIAAGQSPDGMFRAGSPALAMMGYTAPASGPPGFAATASADIASAAADAAAKSYERMNSGITSMLDDIDRFMADQAEDRFNETTDYILAEYDFRKDLEEQRAADEERLRAWRYEQDMESAKAVNDLLTNATNTWLNGATRNAREFGKILLAQLANAAITAAIQNIANAFNGDGSGGGGGGGWFGAALGFVGSLFGGSSSSSSSSTIDGKANGGDVFAGSVYKVGERGEELFKPRVNGTIVPNHALGGGGKSLTIAPQYNITTRADDPRALQRALAENNRQMLDMFERAYNLRPT